MWRFLHTTFNEGQADCSLLHDFFPTFTRKDGDPIDLSIIDWNTTMFLSYEEYHVSIHNLHIAACSLETPLDFLRKGLAPDNPVSQMVKPVCGMAL